MVAIRGRAVAARRSGARVVATGGGGGVVAREGTVEGGGAARAHLDDRQADRSQTEDGDARAVLDLAGVPDGAPACRHAATEQTHLLERGAIVDLGERDLSEHLLTMACVEDCLGTAYRLLCDCYLARDLSEHLPAHDSALALRDRRACAWRSLDSCSGRGHGAPCTRAATRLLHCCFTAVTWL